MSDTSKTKRRRQMKRAKHGKTAKKAVARGLTPKFPIHLNDATAAASAAKS